MASPRLTTFIIGLIWISFAVIVFGAFLQESSAEYTKPNNASIIYRFNNSNSTSGLAGDVQSGANVDENFDLTDVLGGFFSAGYKTLRTAGNSINIFKGMSDKAFSTEVGLPFGESLKAAVISTVLVLIFLGVLISAIVKKDV